MTTPAPMLLSVPSNYSYGLPTKFKPEQAGKRQAEADVVITFAKRVRDWPMLERAVAQMIEDQTQFVDWWNETVTVGHGGDRRASKCAERGRST